MIPRAYITEWRAVAPWSQDAWVEQDLVISRALVALFSVAAVAFTALGLTRVQFRVESRWFRGDAELTTLKIDELMGTKLRALYQRNKGRDLFDLWFALAHGTVNTGALFRCFQRYMAEGGHTVTRAQFEMNLHEKGRSPGFRRDILPLPRPDSSRDFDIRTCLAVLVFALLYGIHISLCYQPAIRVLEHVQAFHGLAAVEVSRATVYRCRCADGGVDANDVNPRWRGVWDSRCRRERPACRLGLAMDRTGAKAAPLP